jgi:uncharacterized protein
MSSPNARMLVEIGLHVQDTPLPLLPLVTPAAMREKISQGGWRNRGEMSDFVVGIGLVLVIEGLLWAIAPRLVFQMLRAASQAPEERLRIGGAIAVAIGVLLVWLARVD